MGRGTVEETGDSTERSTEAADMKGKWMMLKQLVTGPLLSLCRGFFGCIPELVVAHALAWQAPKCCCFQDILSTLEDIGAVDVARDVGGCRWTPLHILPFLQLDQEVVMDSSALTRVFQCMGREGMHGTPDESSRKEAM